MKKLTLIMAMTPSGLIGIDGKLPWKISEDMRRFKAFTTRHAIIMGRKTWDSIGGRPLPNRTNIVVTRAGIHAPQEPPNGALLVCQSLDEAISSAHATDDSPFVIGGAEIYAQALPRATNLEVTYVARREEMPASTTALPLNRRVTRFHFRDEDNTLSYPSMWDWRCTKVESALEERDVEFHSFERRA